MEWVALIAWLLTAGGGFIMLAIWLQRGGMRQQVEAGNRIRPPLLLSHFGLAATGLVLWIIYLASDSDALKWIAFIIILIVALLGWTMFAIWYRQRQKAGVSAAAPASPTNPAASPGGLVPAEQHFPVSVVTIHGITAVVTVVTVFLTVIGVGAD
jgi:hypothetical protein